MERSMRVARGAVIGVAVLGVSTLLHTAAGGCLDHVAQASFWVLGALTVAMCVAFSGRVWTLPRLVGVLAVSQVVMHAYLEGSLPAILQDPDHEHDHAHGLANLLGPENVSMLLAHIAATIVLAMLLRRGDLWLHEAARLISRALPTPPLLGLSPLPAYAAPAPVAPTESGLRRIHYASAVTHRGPPAVVA